MQRFKTLKDDGIFEEWQEYKGKQVGVQGSGPQKPGVWTLLQKQWRALEAYFQKESDRICRYPSREVQRQKSIVQERVRIKEKLGIIVMWRQLQL